MSPKASSLIECILMWCSRPGLYLVCPPMPTEPQIGMLFALLMGYEAALKIRREPSELAPFETWLVTQRPEFKRGPLWFGGQLLEQHGGDLAATLAEITALVQKYQTTTGNGRQGGERPG